MTKVRRPRKFGMTLRGPGAEASGWSQTDIGRLLRQNMTRHARPDVVRGAPGISNAARQLFGRGFRRAANRLRATNDSRRRIPAARRRGPALRGLRRARVPAKLRD